MIANPVPWPNGARCAVAFTFDMDADSILHLAHHTSADTRLAAMSMLRYGPEIAVPRLVELYKRFDMHQTFSCRLVYGALSGSRGGDSARRARNCPPWLFARASERAALRGGTLLAAAGIDVFVTMTGERPRGFRAPTYKFSRHTLTHLVNEGFVYDASLMGDDVPYLLENATGRVELPSHYALDDWPHFMASRDFNYFMSIKPPRQAMEVYAAEFDAMWEYGGLWIAVWHPFLSGRLARCVAIAELIGITCTRKARFVGPSGRDRRLCPAAHAGRNVDAPGRPLAILPGPIPELGEAEPTLAR